MKAFTIQGSLGQKWNSFHILHRQFKLDVVRFNISHIKLNGLKSHQLQQGTEILSGGISQISDVSNSHPQHLCSLQ